MLMRFSQPANAETPILLTLLGIETLSREESSKALSPMEITLFGIVTLLSLQPEKAESIILVTLFGISYDSPVLLIGYKINSVLSLLNNTPSTEEYLVLFSSTFMAERP